MKLILAQPASQRFQWELDVLLTNIRQFTDMEVVLLFTERDFTVPIHFRKEHGCSVFSYTDRRDLALYEPSVRPWLLWQYLKEDPVREQETYLYIDSDVIFREWPDFATLGSTPNKVVGSDCGGYINYNYISKCQRGQEIATKMAEIAGITVEQMKGVPGIGAHIILNQPTAEFWRRAYRDSNSLYIYFQGVNSDIQKWTAEMWAQLWGWVREGYIIEAPKELDFIRSTDDVKLWNKVKILHNAGVREPGELFFKGEYVDKTPFGADFSQINPAKASIKYVEAIQKVLH